MNLPTCWTFPPSPFYRTTCKHTPAPFLSLSHDRAFLNEVATDIIHQHSERLDYYKGSDFDAFYATKEERRKTAKREYEKQMMDRQHLQTFIDKFPLQCRQIFRSSIPHQEAGEDAHLATTRSRIHRPLQIPRRGKTLPPIIQMTNVAFGYTKDRPLLSNVDLDVQLDSRIGIVGPNGAGKTTVLKLLIGALTPTSGLISQNPRLRIGFFAQHHVDALDMNTSAVGFMQKNYTAKPTKNTAATSAPSASPA